MRESKKWSLCPNSSMMMVPVYLCSTCVTCFWLNGQLSVPVFSLATLNADGSTNMNIVTYASPVGIEPERMWMVSLYQVMA